MDFISFDKIQTYGDLQLRAQKNLQRMETEPFQPEKVFQDPAYNWPGDWEGRTLLALISDEKVLGVSAQYMPEIMQKLEQHLNADKYFGEQVKDVVSEQLLSGNSWFLRAVCEHYAKYQDAQCYNIVKSIHDSLLVRLLPFYEQYPTDISVRGNLGEAMGDLLQTSVNGWRLSTDTACAFIPLDGYTAVYDVIPSEQLKKLIERCIEIFDSIDKVGIRCQTHATLSGTRGILRFYRQTGNSAYLKKAKELFDLYVSDGMTVNFANYNWFHRPEWTEGCAVVDSFIVAMELFAYTGEYYYAQMVNRIYENAFRFSQRYNGGLGCDICTTETQPILRGGDGIFEAFWCCSMRCGEGIYRLSSFQYLTEGDTVIVPLYNANEVRLFDGAVSLLQEYDGTNTSTVRFIVKKAQKAFTLKLYVPAYAKSVCLNGEIVTPENGFVTLSINQECEITLSFDMPVTKDDYRGKTRYFVGDRMLGEIIEGEGSFGKKYQEDGKELYEIVNMLMQDETSTKIKQKVIF